MKARYIALVAGLMACSLAWGQTDEKSSGQVMLKMSKKKPVKTENHAVEGSRSTTIHMTKQKAETPALPAASDAANGFAWMSPAFTSVKTAKNTYLVKGTVEASESIRFINIFQNGQFVKNIIPAVPNMKQMIIDEDVSLDLGPNEMKVEAVTVSGKKIQSNLNIVYDISLAKYFALVIAVEEYDDPNISDLDNPIDDAQRFINTIASRYTFEQENINFLKNPSKADIIGTLHKMRSELGSEDNLLIYYAGHGHYDEEMKTGYWLPSDAGRDNPVDWLPNTDLTNYLNVLKTKHTLLIADACFSGGIFKTRAAFNNALEVEKLYSLNSRKAMTSGALSEVPDKSQFVHYLIQNLKDNSKKYMTSEQLYMDIKTPVINNSDNVPQFGTIQKVGDEGGDFIFIRRR